MRIRKELTLSSEVAGTGTDWLETSSGGSELQSQALVCIMRRLVNIVYGMMKNKTEYREPTLEEKQ